MPPTFVTSYTRPDGTVVTVPLDPSVPEQAQIIRDQAAGGDPNLRELTETERQELNRRAYTQSVREQVQNAGPLVGALSSAGGAAIGALDELTMGQDRAALRALLGDRQEARLEGFLGATPTAYTAGRIFGGVVPALATGGETLAQRSAATMTAGGFANQFGNTVRAAFVERFAPRLGEGAATALGATLGAGADGAMSGLTAAITEANIADEPLTGERVMANVLMGASLGLGVGGFGGALEGRVVSLETRAARQAAASLEEAGMARVLREGDVPPLRSIAEAADPPQRSWLTERLRNSFVFPNDEARQAFDRVAANVDRAYADEAWGATVGTYARRFGSDLRVVEEGAASVLNPTERQALFRAAAAEAPEIETTAGRQALRNASAALNEPVGGTVLGARARAVLRRAQASVDALEDVEPGELVGALDRLLDDLPRTLDDRAGAPILAELRERLNAAGERFAPQFRTVREARDTYEAALRDIEFLGRREADGTFRADAGRISDELGHSAFAQRGRNRDLLDRWFRAADEALGQAGDDAVRQNILRPLLDEGNEIARWGELVGSRRYLESLETQGAGVQAAIGNKASNLMAAGFVGGGVIGGPVGAAVGSALGIGMAMFGHPLGTVRTLSSLSQMLGKGERRVAQASQRLRTALERPRVLTGSRARAAGLGGRQVPRVVLALRDARQRQEEYDAIVDRVREYAGNPQLLLERVSAMTEAVGATHPGVAAGQAQSMVAAVQHLAENLPPASAPSPFPLQRRRPSAGEMEDMDRRVEAIEDPASILERAADGSLTAAHVDAVRAVYPRLYAQLSAEVAAMLGDLRRLPPYQLRARIGLLLGVPADPTLDPRFVWASQQTYAQSAQQNEAQLGHGPTATMSMRVSDDTMTRAASVTHNL